MNLKKQVQALSATLGFDLVGVAPVLEPPHFAEYEKWISKGWHGSMSYLKNHLTIKKDPRLLLPSAKSIIVVAQNYNQPNPARNGQPRIARYALGRDYHKVLRRKLRTLAKQIDLLAPGFQHRVCVDSAPIMERDFAQLAGIGWFGKNTMLINSERGSWFFIGLMLTSLELEPDQPAVGGCGTCRKCIEACPTGAIVLTDDQWQVDARSCISYLTIEHKGDVDHRVGEWTFGCDVCQEVCPFNQQRSSQPLRAQITVEPDFIANRVWPSLEQLSNIEWDEWDRITRGSAVRRAGMTKLRQVAAQNLSSQDTGL